MTHAKFKDGKNIKNAHVLSTFLHASMQGASNQFAPSFSPLRHSSSTSYPTERLTGCASAKAAGLVGYTWHISACPFLFRHLWRKAAPRKAHDDTMAPVRWHQVSECAQHRAATETTQPAQAPHPRLKS